MGLFNFINKSADNDATPQVVILQLNSEQVTVPASEINGRSIQQLFDDYSEDLGDTDRIGRYVTAGRVVSDDTIAQPGAVYRGAISSEQKG